MSENKKQRKGLSKSLKTFFGIGDLGFSFMTNIETYYFQYFLTDIAKFSVGFATTIGTVSSIIDAALSWVYGIILDKVKPMKWGRYRSWLIVLPWIVPFLYAFQFLKVGSGVGAAIIIILGFATSHICWNIPWVANLTMVRVAGKTPEDRATLSSSRTTWSSIARVAYSYVGPWVVGIISGWLGEQYGYAGCAFAFGVLMAVGYFAHFKMFEGYEASGEEEIAQMEAAKAQRAAEKEAKKANKGNLGRALACNPSLWGLILADFTKYVYSFGASAIAIYYFTYVAKDAGLNNTYIFASNLLGVATAYLSRKFVAKFSARGAMISSYACMAAVCLIAFLFYSNVWVVFVMMCLAQGFSMLTTACAPMLYADCCIYSHYKTGTDNTGAIMGLTNLPLKVGVVMRSIIVGASLAIGGFDPNTTTVENVTPAIQRGISMGFSLIPAIVLAVGLLLMVFVYRLTKEKVNECSAEIARREGRA